MQYLIMLNTPNHILDNGVVGYTQDLSVVRWFAQHIHGIFITEYNNLDDMVNDMKHQGLEVDVNYLYTGEYEANYSDVMQSEYPPIMVDDCYVDDVSLNDFIESIEMIASYYRLIHDYMKDGDMKSIIECAMDELIRMNYNIMHHRLTDGDTEYDPKIVTARWILKDEYYNYYLGEY